MEKIKNKHHISNYNTRKIYTILDMIRNSYFRKTISWNKRKICCRQSIFTHINGAQVWVIGAIEATTKNFHIDNIKERNATKIEKFIKIHVPINSSIITDGWSGYSWLDRPNSNYVYIVHSYATGDFGYGDESTSP